MKPTLIEILCVVTIIAILVMLGAAKYRDYYYINAPYVQHR